MRLERVPDVRVIVLAVVLLRGAGGYQPSSESSSHSHTYSYQLVRRGNFEQNFLEDEGTRWFCVVLGVCMSTTVQPPSVLGNFVGLAPVYQWSQLEFDYASEAERQVDIQSKEFIPGTPAPIDVDVFYAPDAKNKIFVTIPRFQAGLPIALGTVSDKKYNNNPVITPYPDWSWHRNPKSCLPDRIVSVYRVKIDECGRLWVLDTGRLLEEQACPPQILAFDLQTDQLIHRYEIPSSQVESRSILVTPVVDVRDSNLKCRDTFVYVADCQAYSIIVYDVRHHTSWRVTDKTMYPYPNYGTFSILGDSFDLMDGILGMALSPYKPGEDRKLFYHAMSSPTENWVYTSDLRNQSRFKHDPSSSPHIFHTYRGGRNTQSAAEAMDKNGIMYFGLMSEVTLDCWNTKDQYGPNSIDVIGNNKETLQFASGVKVITNRRGGQELWVLTSRFQKVAADTQSTSEINFRVQAGKIEDLISGTKCKRGGHGGHRGQGGQGAPYPPPQQAQASEHGGGYGLRPTPQHHISSAVYQG